MVEQNIDILKGAAVNQDKVGGFSLADGADPVIESQDFRRDAGSGYHGFRGCKTAFDKKLQLPKVFAVQIQRGSRVRRSCKLVFRWPSSWGRRSFRTELRPSE